MTEKVKKALAALCSAEYKQQRIDNGEFDMTDELMKLPKRLRRLPMMEAMLQAETPMFLEEDIFGFHRRNKQTVSYVDLDGRRLRSNGGNLTPNYARVIGMGFDGVLEIINERLQIFRTEDSQIEFLETMKKYVDAVFEICERYRIAARQTGRTRLAEALERIPHKPAESFYEACLFFQIIVYTLRCASYNHVTLGRFDQYMYPYYQKDVARGASREELLETLELFFISLNADGDLYIGMQQGDNGQSMMLGGYDKDGNSMYNELTFLCMDAAEELTLIDPKINLRVNKTTPDEIYEYGTRLTKQGLGFPQYCNDDIAIPYLRSIGYDEDDAYDYTVAACWEYIVPNCAVDVPNRATMNFPYVVNNAIRSSLPTAKSFDEVLAAAKEEIAKESQRLRQKYSPTERSDLLKLSYGYLSIFVDGCLEKGLDLSQGGAKYYNYGCHGAGIATAADALEAVRTVIFEGKSITPDELLAALDADFKGYEVLQNRLLSCAKMGNNVDTVDAIAGELMETFAASMNHKPNDRYGGVWRAGTGSAMEYISSARVCPATADGRHAGEAYGCSFSPAITTRLDGPLSVIQSFTKFDLTKICNGGPLTLEVHDTVFRNAEGEKKVAQLVKAFIHLGGHQLQINSINRDRLLDAQEHPEKYPNLIVRVWGWSGYFCELDREYQDHVIRRTEFRV
ncbi:MAG: pyruvate formate-lyase [Clostridia bacterium]|nr:pyruvate formate-lyase [Clostridia bacterium]